MCAALLAVICFWCCDLPANSEMYQNHFGQFAVFMKASAATSKAIEMFGLFLCSALAVKYLALSGQSNVLCTLRRCVFFSQVQSKGGSTRPQSSKFCSYDGMCDTSFRGNLHTVP